MSDVKLSERIRRLQLDVSGAVLIAADERETELQERNEQMLEALRQEETRANRYSAQLTDLRKRVAELEACMQQAGLMAFMRNSSPEEVAKHLAEVAAGNIRCVDELKARVAWLEGVVESKEKLQAWLEKTLTEANSRIADLQSQLAWTPVSAGLPTEPGVYEFATKRGWVYSWRRDEDGCWQDEREDDFYDAPVCDLQPFVIYRRIELPTGGES